jgi:predicted DNA-binding transcriptional regulator YafY
MDNKKLVEFVIARSERFVVAFDYVDRKGKSLRRVVSPCQIIGKRMLGLCLVRGDWRYFELSKCEAMQIGLAFDQLAPIANDATAVEVAL